MGGGFGGLTAARAFRHSAVDVTVIDRNNHHTFQPLLSQVATATLNPSDITAPIRHVLRGQRNVTVLLAEVERIDVRQHTLTIDEDKLKGKGASEFGGQKQEFDIEGKREKKDKD